jgi:putative membrane protein
MSTSANGQSRNDDWHMMDGWRHMMDFRGGGIGMWVILLVVIGVVVYLLVNRSSTQQFFSTPEETPLDILKRRYAKGEITKEDYEQMKRDLE